MCKRKLLLQVKKGFIKARMSFDDKKEESNEDEAGSEIEYREGDPHKPRQFYKAGRKYIIDG